MFAALDPMSTKEQADSVYLLSTLAWSREVDGIGRPCTSNDYEAFFRDEVSTDSAPSETESMRFTSCIASPYADSRMLKSTAKKVVKAVKKVFKPRPRIKRPKGGVMSHNIDADEMMPQPDVDVGRDWFGRDDDGLSHLEKRLLEKAFKKLFKSHKKDKPKPKPPTITGKPHRGNLDHGLAHDYLQRHKGNSRITIPDDYGQLLNRVKNKIKDKRELVGREASLPSPDDQRRLTKEALVKSKKQAVKTKKVVVKKVKAGFREVTGSKPQRIQQEPDPFLPKQGNGFADFYRRKNDRRRHELDETSLAFRRRSDGPLFRLSTSTSDLERRLVKDVKKVVKKGVQKIRGKGGKSGGTVSPVRWEGLHLQQKRLADNIKKVVKAVVKKVQGDKKDTSVAPVRPSGQTGGRLHRR